MVINEESCRYHCRYLKYFCKKVCYINIIQYLNIYRFLILYNYNSNYRVKYEYFYKK